MALPKGLPLDRLAARRWYSERLAAAAADGDDVYREARRWLGRNDLFYLLVALLKCGFANNDWFFERCREVQADPNGHLDLWAREHGKSTIITFAQTVQDILNDPEITVGIFSHTRPIAKQFLRQIKTEFEGNADLKDLYDDILYADPHRDSPKWSEDEGITVKRKTNPKEATVEAWGLVDGQPTSKHFGLRVYDDVVTKESVTSPEMIQKTTSAWELSSNLGTIGGTERYIGTRYHLFDSYAEMMKRGSVKVRLHPATSDGTDNVTKSVYMPVDVLAKKRRDQGLYTFACQMLQNPKADKAMGFQEQWLRYWPARHFDGLNFYILVDPASKKKKASDYTVIWVVGVGADGNWYVCDCIRDRLNLGERGRAVMAMHRKWSTIGPVQKVVYEEYGLQADIEYIKELQERENYRFAITAVGGTVAKEDRIKRLVPKFEHSNIYLPEAGLIRTNYEGQAQNLIELFKAEEYLAFPVCAHDDMLDCLARMEDESVAATAPTTVPRHEPSWKDELMEEYAGGGGGSWTTN
jgi:predicted phage terminase large subunit-like protein